MTNGEKHIEKLLSWYKEAVTEDGVCYLTADDKNTLAYALKCCKHYEDIKKDIDSWMLREEPGGSEKPNKSEIPTGSNTKNDLGVELIDRAELLKAMDTWDKFGYTARYGLERLDKDDKDFVPYVKYDDMVNCVEGMPSVKPQEPKIGHWIRQTDDYHDYYECEHCGIAVGLDDIKNYCPNCGADMREVEE